MLRELNNDMHLWDVLVDPARKIRVGNKLYFGDDDMLVAEVVDNTTSRGRTIRFLHDGYARRIKKDTLKRWEKHHFPNISSANQKRKIKNATRLFLQNTKEQWQRLLLVCTSAGNC